MIRDMTSAPMASTCSCVPVATSCRAVVRAYVNPEQAAPRSNPQAVPAPILSWTRQAVLGKNMSGVVVPTTRNSMSDGVRCAWAIALRAASAARSDVATPSSAMWRSRTPVRLRIHSSDVSTIASRSLLVSTRGGTEIASEEICTRRTARTRPSPGRLDAASFI